MPRAGDANVGTAVGGWEPGDRAAKRHVVVVGMSTRALAESAARAGYRVTALDAFGDLDQHPRVRALSMPRDVGARYSAEAAARAAQAIVCDAVVYQSDFENHPDAVRLLTGGESGATLLGNAPETLTRVRDPGVLAAALRARGCGTPAVVGRAADVDPSTSWLVKPYASGGGRGVRPWRPGAPIPTGHYVQQRIEGVPGSVVFVSDGRRAVVLGVSRQLVGEAAFGARGFRYCGSILARADDGAFGAASTDDGALVDAAARLADAATEAFGLVGVNGVDFIARDGVPHAIEVNPRYTASMELVERAYGVSVFGAHAAACAEGVLPTFDVRAARQGTRVTGKAVVFAPRTLRAGDTRAWLADATVRDVPHPDEAIAAGGPVCTVFADGADTASCHAALVRRAGKLYSVLGVDVAGATECTRAEQAAA